jgi:hypothetical protein
MPTGRRDWRVAIGALCVCAAGCGQKGPPLAPLRPVPAAVTEVTVRRIDKQVRLRFVLPTTNATGPGQLELDHVEIYAMTAAPGYTPTNRHLFTKEFVIGTVPVKPPAVEGEEPKEGDTRPDPGSAVVFDDELTEAKLKPVMPLVPPAPVPPPAAAAAAAAAGAAAAAPAAAPVSKDPLRVYAVRGVTKSGRFGPPSTRVAFPLVPLPAPPPAVTTRQTETALVIEWTLPPGATPNIGYNVFRSEDPLQPINPQPIAGSSLEYAEAQMGQTYCFRLRSAFILPPAYIEGELSEEECATPKDIFPPAAPRRPDAVATAGQISLIWDPNTDKDLAGYIVLRGEPDGPLQPLTPAPIKETSFRDTTVTPGTRYVYAIVAVDTATPPNSSPQSPRVEETAR